MSVRGLVVAAAGNATPPSGFTSRYWRIFISSANGGAVTGFTEIEFRAAAGGADLTTPSTPAAESSTLAHPAAKTVDNDLSGSSWWLALTPANEWASYDSGASLLVAQIAIYPYGADLPRAPKNFKVQGGTSLFGPWTDLKEFTNVTGWVAGEWKLFDL